MILRALLERGVDAIALLGAEHSREVFAILATHNTPFVMMWASDSKEGDCIGFDEEAAAALLVNHLADLGHSRIGFIGGRTDNKQRAARRLTGLTSSIAKRGVMLNTEAFIETDTGFCEGFGAQKEHTQ